MLYNHRLKQLQEYYFRRNCNKTKLKGKTSLNLKKATWLKRRKQVIISKHYLISLSMRSIYKDEV